MPTPSDLSFDVIASHRGITNDTLAEIMRQGVPPDLSALAGWEFRGVNIAPITGLLGIRKFKKGFFEGSPKVPSGPEPFIQGYNVIVKQNGLASPHVAVPSETEPKRHGFFRVYNAGQSKKDHVYPQALLLDYGLGDNGLTPSALLRDYLVQVRTDNADLLLGHAFLAVGGARIPAGFFVLERYNQHSFHG